LRNKPKLIEKTIVDDKGVVGTIIVHLTTEISAVFADRPIRDRVKAIKDTENYILENLLSKGFRDFHVFTQSKTFADILKNHFGFEDQPGIALVRRF
jgi:hypothetical protein